MKDFKIVIGIPTLNRLDLLKESLHDLSLNMQNIDQLIIVDNGRQNISPQIPDTLQLKTTLIENQRNAGVSASWNKILEIAFEIHGATHVLILNDDIVFGKTLDQVKDFISRYNVDFLCSDYFWSAFILSKKCFDRIGKFDEVFYPAYYEDNDYWYRIQLDSEIDFLSTKEMDPITKRNSMTIKKDSSINKDFELNKRRFKLKWGGLPGEETYRSAYNK